MRIKLLLIADDDVLLAMADFRYELASKGVDIITRKLITGKELTADIMTNLVSEKIDIILVLRKNEFYSDVCLLRQLFIQQPIFASGNKDSVEEVIKYKKSGATGYYPHHLLSEMIEDILQQKHLTPGVDQLTNTTHIAIYSVDHAGTSAIAAGISQFLSQKSEPVLLVDSVFSCPGVADWFDPDAPGNGYAINTDIERMDYLLLTGLTRKVNNNIALIDGLSPETLSPMSGINCLTLNNIVNNHYRYVIWRAEAIEGREHLPMADYIFLVVQPRVSSLRATQKVINDLLTIKANSNLFIVLSDYSGESIVTPNIVSSILGKDIAFKIKKGKKLEKSRALKQSFLDRRHPLHKLIREMLVKSEIAPKVNHNRKLLGVLFNG